MTELAKLVLEFLEDGGFLKRRHEIPLSAVVLLLDQGFKEQTRKQVDEMSGFLAWWAPKVHRQHATTLGRWDDCEAEVCKSLRGSFQELRQKIEGVTQCAEK